MTTKKIKVSNKLGLHARPATMLVKEASKYDSTIKLVNDTTEVSAKSIMGLLVLAAGKGTELEIRAEGPDEEEAVEAVANLFSSNFDEE